MSTWIGIIFSCTVVFGGFFATLMWCSKSSIRNAELAKRGELRPYSPRARRELDEYLDSLDPQERKAELDGWAEEFGGLGK